MTTIFTELAAAAATLEAVSETPRLDAELLMAHALGMAREKLLLWGMDQDVSPQFDNLLTRRLAHEPIAYIIGTKAFWSIELTVTPDVLIPRPDSETLIAAAVAHFGQAGPNMVLDLGTGSGALLLAALSEWPSARGVGVDSSEAALTIARGNAAALGLANRAVFLRGNWCEGLTATVDLILSNPPYVETGASLAPNVSAYEPHSALFAGEDGLADYECLIPQLARVLAPKGIVCLEIGHTQRAAVTVLAEAEGFKVTCHQDLGGRDRCLLLTL
jgi:release factor glutamine methyltransferase